MTTKQLIALADGMADLGVPEECFSDDVTEVSDDKALSLVQCCNVVLEKVHIIFPDVKTAEFTCDGNFADITDDVFYVISLKDGFGNSVAFRRASDRLFVPNGFCGKLHAVYAALPGEVGWTSTLNLPDPKITGHVFACGVIAEYLFENGDFSEAEKWNAKFIDGLQLAVRKKSHAGLPARRWL